MYEILEIFQNIKLDFIVSTAISIIPIVISIVALKYTHDSNKRQKEAEKHNKENDNWKKEFEIYKETNRQNEILLQTLLFEKKTMASIKPYFNIILKDDRIKREGNDLILGIGFINIGKESAINIQLSPKYSDKKYFDSKGHPEKEYDVHEYLSQYYAIVREEVMFKIKVKLADDEKIMDFIKFTIKYSDLIGNRYEQEFKFGFYMKDSIEYNLDNMSYEPQLLKN